MKESNYNFFYDIDNSDEVIAYNSRTNAMATMKKEDVSKITSFTNDIIENDDIRLVEDLKHGGFLIDDDFDELAFLKYSQNIQKYDSKTLSLTIAPTMGCNFDCIYCYESNHTDYTKMSKEVQKAIINLLLAQKDTINNFQVSWYGGEPLLAFDIIEDLSNEFIKICNENNIRYSAGIVTNGYLLSEDNANKMVDLKINNIQVTIDGPQDIHDQRRYLLNKEPTFNKIISNLKFTNGIIPNVSIRINTDIKNCNRVNEVLHILEQNGLVDKTFPYLGYVEPTNDQYDSNSCLKQDRYLQVNDEFIDLLETKNDKISRLFKYPRLNPNLCTATNLNSFIVNFDGDLYKCWSDIGIKDHCIGNIKTGINKMKRIFSYCLYEVTENPKCTNCKYIPICMGGCPRKRIDNSLNQCSLYKFSLEKYLKLCANEIVNKNLEADKVIATT